MKIVRLAAALFAVSGLALAQSEGVAEFKGTVSQSEGKSVPSTARVYFKKDVAYRSEMEMDFTGARQEQRGASRGMTPGRYRVVTIQKLSDPDRMVTINEETKTYSILDLKKSREDSPETRTTYTVKKLGRDSVAGHSCEKALVTSSTGREMELCIATDLFPSAGWLAAQGRGHSANFLSALRENALNGFPIRWIVRDKKDQRVTATMELTRLESRSVPSSLFEVPAGYRETSAMGVTMTPEQEKAMKDALDKMTPEQRKMYEEMMKKQQEKR